MNSHLWNTKLLLFILMLLTMSAYGAVHPDYRQNEQYSEEKKKQFHHIINSCTSSLLKYAVYNTNGAEVDKCKEFLSGFKKSEYYPVVIQYPFQKEEFNNLIEEYTELYFSVSDFVVLVREFREKLQWITAAKDILMPEFMALTGYIENSSLEQKDLYLEYQQRNLSILDIMIRNAQGALDADPGSDQQVDYLDKVGRFATIFVVYYDDILVGNTERRVPRLNDKRARKLIANLNLKTEHLKTTVIRVLELTPFAYKLYQADIPRLEEITNDISNL